MIPWRNAKTAEATVVDIRDCDKIMDRLADDVIEGIQSILMNDGASIVDAQVSISTMVYLARSEIQSMAEEVRVIKE